MVFGIGGAAWAQSQTLSITLTGQSMIRSDIRAHAPAAVPVIESLLKGDVVFTNFETTILDVKKGQSPKDGRFLSPPEARPCTISRYRLSYFRTISSNENLRSA